MFKILILSLLLLSVSFGQMNNFTWTRLDTVMANLDTIGGGRVGISVPNIQIQGVNSINIVDGTEWTFPLTNGTYRLFNNQFVDNLSIVSGDTVNIIADSPGLAVIATGTGNIISCADSTDGIGQLILNGFTVLTTGANSTLFNSDGCIVAAEGMNFISQNTGQSMGKIVNSPLSVTFERGLFVDYDSGIMVDSILTRFLIDRYQFITQGKSIETAITVGDTVGSIEVTGVEFTQLPTDTLFNIDSLFVGGSFIENITNTGASVFFSNTSLTQTSPYVNVVNSAPQASSANILSVGAYGNSTATSIAVQNTWYDINLGGLAGDGSDAELWETVNTTTGEVVYRGIQPFKGQLFAAISGNSAGGSQVFEFRVIKNGSPLPDNAIFGRSTGSDLGFSGYISPMEAVAGDTIQMQVKNTGGTSDMTIQYFGMTAVSR